MACKLTYKGVQHDSLVDVEKSMWVKSITDVLNNDPLSINKMRNSLGYSEIVKVIEDSSTELLAEQESTQITDMKQLYQKSFDSNIVVEQLYTNEENIQEKIESCIT